MLLYLQEVPGDFYFDWKKDIDYFPFLKVKFIHWINVYFISVMMKVAKRNSL